MYPIRNDGPFVNVATVCRARHRQADGTVDLLGIVRNRLVMDASFLELVKERQLRLVTVVTLDGGHLRGAYPFALRTKYPGGTEEMLARLLEFTDDAPQATMEAPLVVDVDQPGEYCVDVLFDQRCLTTIVVEAARPALHLAAMSDQPRTTWQP